MSTHSSNLVVMHADFFYIDCIGTYFFDVSIFAMSGHVKSLKLRGIVYYESIKREPKIKSIYEYRCDERLQTKSKEFTRLPYTGLVLELEHLKIQTRLVSERFANAMGECAN